MKHISAIFLICLSYLISNILFKIVIRNDTKLNLNLDYLKDKNLILYGKFRLFQPEQIKFFEQDFVCSKVMILNKGTIPNNETCLNNGTSCHNQTCLNNGTNAKNDNLPKPKHNFKYIILERENELLNYDEYEIKKLFDELQKYTIN